MHHSPQQSISIVSQGQTTNGYTLGNEGENSEYVQFYKEYNPNK